jgi:hypothetical protein
MAEQAGIDCSEGRVTERQYTKLMRRLERASILVSQGPNEPKVITATREPTPEGTVGK